MPDMFMYVTGQQLLRLVHRRTEQLAPRDYSVLPSGRRVGPPFTLGYDTTRAYVALRQRFCSDISDPNSVMDNLTLSQALYLAALEEKILRRSRQLTKNEALRLCSIPAAIEAWKEDTPIPGRLGNKEYTEKKLKAAYRREIHSEPLVYKLHETVAVFEPGIFITHEGAVALRDPATVYMWGVEGLEKLGNSRVKRLPDRTLRYEDPNSVKSMLTSLEVISNEEAGSAAFDSGFVLGEDSWGVPVSRRSGKSGLGVGYYPTKTAGFFRTEIVRIDGKRH